MDQLKSTDVVPLDFGDPLLQKELSSPINFDMGNQIGFMQTRKSMRQKLAESLTIPDELPNLPERLRDFAFRFATESRTNRGWAAIFHVSPHTIRNWLLKPAVMQYVLKVRKDRKTLMMGRLLDLENKALSKLSDILECPITPETIDSIRAAIKDILSLKRESGDSDGGDGKVVVNVNQSQVQAQKSQIDNSEENIEIELKSIQHKLKEIAAIEQVLSKEEVEDG